MQELIGEPATKLHMGRSRNDQVVTDMKLWMRKNLKVINSSIRTLISVIVKRSLNEIDIFMPGYTHLQRAQPVRWSHYLLRYYNRYNQMHSYQYYLINSSATRGI